MIQRQSSRHPHCVASGHTSIRQGFPLVTKDAHETAARAAFVYDSLYASIESGGAETTKNLIEGETMKGIKARSGALHLLIPAGCALLLMISSLSSAQQQVSTADWKPVEQALGKSGSMQPGDVYKVSFPRSDLKVTAAGVEL